MELQLGKAQKCSRKREKSSSSKSTLLKWISPSILALGSVQDVTSQVSGGLVMSGGLDMRDSSEGYLEAWYYVQMCLPVLTQDFGKLKILRLVRTEKRVFPMPQISLCEEF